MQSDYQPDNRRRITSVISIWIFGIYGVIAPAASALKAWQTILDDNHIGWLAKTNAIIWDTITLPAPSVSWR